MKLSIIIVNYNVRYFLEQCLTSLNSSIKNYEENKSSSGIEIIVVDNNSVDGSVKLVKEKFPQLKLIENKENVGFSKANNQAIRQSEAEYVLLLNPDTIVEDDTIEKVIAFMDSHPDAGGLGVKMLNGKGKFLPESKRGIPTPEVAFYKIFGLSMLFPRSKRFGKYHLGYLDKDKTHQVPVLSGAFMLLRKEALDKSGLLDETFFMYGEDIDLSYRLIKAGYNNYYYPETRIIHYKGESTKKSSINYVLMFYKAMIIFATKHFSVKNARLFRLLINIAIYLRALIAISSRLVKRIFIPLADLLLTFGGIYLIKNYWEYKVILSEGSYYPKEFISIVVPSYILIWMLSVYLSGGYDKPFRLKKAAQGIAIGTVIILVIYALLPEAIRFSRAIILLGTVWAFFSMFITRAIRQIFKYRTLSFNKEINKRYAIAGEETEVRRVADIIRKTNYNPSFIGLVSINGESIKDSDYIGSIEQLKDITEIYKIDEIIFCGKDISAQKIIDLMTNLELTNIDYKIAPPESLYIIGSNSISDAEDLYVININSVNNVTNKRNKRFADLIVSLILLAISPAAIFIIRKPFSFIINIFSVLYARKSWVGYDDKGGNEKLPKIRKGVLNPSDAFRNRTFTDDLIFKMNMLYAKDYKAANDLNIIFKGFRELGR